MNMLQRGVLLTGGATLAGVGLYQFLDDPTLATVAASVCGVSLIAVGAHNMVLPQRTTVAKVAKILIATAAALALGMVAFDAYQDRQRAEEMARLSENAGALPANADNPYMDLVKRSEPLPADTPEERARAERVKELLRTAP